MIFIFENVFWDDIINYIIRVYCRKHTTLRALLLFHWRYGIWLSRKMSKITWNESTTADIIRPISECDSHKNKVVPIPITMDFITLQGIRRTRSYTLVTPPQWLMTFRCSRFLWLYIFFFNSGFKILFQKELRRISLNRRIWT